MDAVKGSEQLSSTSNPMDGEIIQNPHSLYYPTVKPNNNNE